MVILRNVVEEIRKQSADGILGSEVEIQCDRREVIDFFFGFQSAILQQ